MELKGIKMKFHCGPVSDRLCLTAERGKTSENI